ncbi:MAG: multidrug efflux SMR transporter [Phenylobacterium sp.]|uniref:DMT family transporter n=1 Tax=Phenylobacterium sp. TaxID=1871053 RepID=UPI001A481A5B|nr:multidrug efflux SMR transporter [Phenylobacterium sp.]MBL8773022.1 multidrug efflux SMR transporter [Phenylobacterium sp.]
MTAWLYLAAAIALEIGGTFFLKLSNGFEKAHWGAVSIALYSACFWVLAPALKAIPVGVAYAIWSGVGIMAAGAIGAFAFGERLGPLQLGFIALILVGAVGLRLTTAEA